MVDARLPDRWLLNSTLRDLSDIDWRVFTGSLMLGNNQLTDGFIPFSALALTHPQGVQPESYKRLVEAELWLKTQGGYQVADWAETQTLKSTFEAQKLNNRQRQKLKRERDAAKLLVSSNTQVTGDVTRDVQGDARKGKDRKGLSENDYFETPSYDLAELDIDPRITRVTDPATGEISEVF